MDTLYDSLTANGIGVKQNLNVKDRSVQRK